jgi:hypothetical protein
VTSGRREHDAVREARDALVILAAAVPVTAAVAVLIGLAWGDVTDWAIWMIGSVVVAVLLMGTLGSALLVADQLGARLTGTHPHAVSRMWLIGIALVAGVVLVGGLPATWPIVIGFGLVCVVLAAVVLVGAAVGTH